MEPKGAKLSEVLATMKAQEARCADLLGKLTNGEGSLFKVNMSVNGIGAHRPVSVDLFHSPACQQARDSDGRKPGRVAQNSGS